MEELKILMVDNHECFRKAAADYLRKQEGVRLVREAANGQEALELLGREPFDVLVTDLVMPQMDGYTLLESMARLRLSPTPKIIVATALARDDFVLRAIERGANFFLVKPYEPQHLLSHIRQVCGAAQPATGLLNPAAGASRVQTLDERLGSLFLTIGIPAHIKGYSYLRQAVKMVIERPDLMSRITKELYPGIAKHFGTSASKVERAIRHAIEVAWNRGRIETLNSAFGCRVCTPEDKPTNGEFIAMLADKLSMERSA
ncbi:MAG: sporulation transcription factor Spo0A [Clostridia bacterium]|nr:sporulation transcription factor Spo0A [Clostridia bacterium]